MSRLRRRRLGPGSYLALLLWALLLVALLPDSRLGLLLVALVGLGWLDGGAGLRALGRGRFWLLVLSIVALASLILGEPDVRWGILGFSMAGLRTGLGMALRAVTVVLAFGVSLGALTVGEMIQLFEGFGLRGMGLALGVALNLGPVLGDTVEAAYHTLRLRGGFRRPAQATRLFLVTVIANALRYGDDVVKAALARGFDPAADSVAREPVLRRADRVFIGGLVVAGAVALASAWSGG